MTKPVLLRFPAILPHVADMQYNPVSAPIDFSGNRCAIPGCPFSLCVVVGGGTIGGSGCSFCGLRFEGVVVVVDVTTTTVVVFDATTSRHKGFEGILQVMNITTVAVAAVIIPARGTFFSLLVVFVVAVVVNFVDAVVVH